MTENYIDPFSFEQKNSAVDITFNGNSVGLVIDVRPKFSDEVKKVNAKHQRELAERMRKNGGKLSIDFAAGERQTKERVVAHVAGWKWKDGAPGIGGVRPDFSEESLRNMLDHKIFGPVLQDQILDEADDIDSFLEKSAGN